jgi:hypothetical protein
MQATVQKEVSSPGPGEAKGKIVVGNWDDPALLTGETYEVVLADYLIGAMDGFSPFTQDLIFERLKKHMDPATGIMYIIGLEPIPYQAEYPEDIFLEVTRIRDACILLAGHRCYREHPLTWVQRQLQANGFRVLESTRLPILYSESSIRRQLNVARAKLPRFKDRALAKAMATALDELDLRVVATANAQPNRRIAHGFDYIIAAEVDSAFCPAPPATTAE